MKRVALTATAILLLVLGVLIARAAVATRPPATQPAPSNPPVAHHLELPAADAGLRFVPVDVFLDTGTRTLGAYQVEIIAKNADIVGLEGGEPAPFQKAPYYDPAALQGAGNGGGRIIVAAFSTDADLPSGASRVARLHLAVRGSPADKPDLTSKLVVATDGNGQAIDTHIELRISPEGDRK
jgi:hypothetical protein